MAIASPYGATLNNPVLQDNTGTLSVTLYVGSGAPTFAATKGSLYIRTDGSSTSTRMYINTTGSTTWTNFTTAA